MVAGPPTTLTKSLHLHDYHKCNASTLRVRTPGEVDFANIANTVNGKLH